MASTPYTSGIIFIILENRECGRVMGVTSIFRLLHRRALRLETLTLLSLTSSTSWILSHSLDLAKTPTRDIILGSFKWNTRGKRNGTKIPRNSSSNRPLGLHSWSILEFSTISGNLKVSVILSFLEKNEKFLFNFSLTAKTIPHYYLTNAWRREDWKW